VGGRTGCRQWWPPRLPVPASLRPGKGNGRRGLVPGGLGKARIYPIAPELRGGGGSPAPVPTAPETLPPSTSERQPALIGAAACTWCAPTAAEAGAKTKASAGAPDRGNTNGPVDQGVACTGGTRH
jgi:hypothetical protein